jgi:hypothetical protein
MYRALSDGCKLQFPFNIGGGRPLPNGHGNWHCERVTDRLEFWPEYRGVGPLWEQNTQSVDLHSLPLPDDLRGRLVVWNSAFDDAKLPIEGKGDDTWLDEGRRLLSEIRVALDGQYEVEVHEDWWGEPGRDFRQPTS